jgi:hypothetical protein
MPPQPAEAGELDRDEARVLIQQVMEADDFGQPETLTYWKYLGEQDEIVERAPSGLLEWLFEVLQGFFQGFATLGEVLLWLAAGAGLAYLIWWFLRNRGLLGDFDTPQRNSPELPMSLAGLDIRPQNLPRDIVTEASRLFSLGEARAGLSLLYRGALSTLVHRDQLQIPMSATEAECLHLAGRFQSAERQRYLQHLTRLWQAQAYAHRTPDAQELERLCRGWGEAYGE